MKNRLSAIGYRLSAIGYRLVLGALLGIAALEAHANSSRAQIESFFSQYNELVARHGNGVKFEEGDPRRYIGAWPQFSKKRLLAKGMDPAKVSLNYADGGKSTPSEVAVVVVLERYFSEPPTDPQRIVANRYVFETKQEPGLGWKILVDSNDGEFATIKSDEMVTWREYVSRGYKDKIERVYAGGASDRGRRESESQSGQTRQLCEAQKKTCLAGCGNPSYWNGSRFVDNQSWSGCQSRCGSIACN